MTRQEHIDKVASFARDYINNVSEQTEERKQAIADAAFVLFAERRGCDSCLIDFAIKIYKMSENNTKYHVLHGAVLEFHSHFDLAMTVHNTTDDLAELHLAEHPQKIKFFDEYPADEEGNWVGITEERHKELRVKFGLEAAEEAEPTGTEITSQEEVTEDVAEEAEPTGKSHRGRPRKN